MTVNYNKAEFWAAFGVSGQLPECDRPEIIFSGRSNVGKSSLINKLCNRKSLARVSATPGKTATVNFYRVGDVHFVDLPGYGYAKVSASERQRWDELINRYFETGRDYTLLVQLVDSRREPTGEDYQMMEYLADREIPFVVALTKCDKLNKTELAHQTDLLTRCCEQYGCGAVIPTSAEKGTGIEILKQAIEQAVNPEEALD